MCFIWWCSDILLCSIIKLLHKKLWLCILMSDFNHTSRDENNIAVIRFAFKHQLSWWGKRVKGGRLLQHFIIMRVIDKSLFYEMFLAMEDFLYNLIFRAPCVHDTIILARLVHLKVLLKFIMKKLYKIPLLSTHI